MRLLYKYLPLQTEEHLVRLRRLVDGWIYFSSPSAFNDPFELSPVVSPPSKGAVAAVLDGIHATEAGISKSTQKRIIENVQSLIRQRAPPAVSQAWMASLGVLCLTEDPKDLLMWAHYASSHTGVCLGFDASFSPFAGAKPVRYSSERPSIPALEPEKFTDGVAESVLLRKSPHWKYEQEWRAVKRPVREDEMDFYRQGIAEATLHHEDVASLLASEGGSGYYEFDSAALRRVILGARTSDDSKSAVQRLLHESGSSAKLLQAEVDKKYFVLNILPCVSGRADR